MEGSQVIALWLPVDNVVFNYFAGHSNSRMYSNQKKSFDKSTFLSMYAAFPISNVIDLDVNAPKGCQLK